MRPSPRATIKVLPATLHHPRPYRSLGLLSVSIASGDASWVAYLVTLVCLSFWKLIATLFATIHEHVLLQVWQTPSAKPATAHVHEEITPPLTESRRAQCVSTALLVSIRSALQATWQKRLFSSRCKANEPG